MATNKKVAAQPTSSDEKPSEDVVVTAAEQTGSAEPGPGAGGTEETESEETESEETESEKPEPSVDEDKSDSVTDFNVPPVYPTAFYAGNGIPYCDLCGECDRNDGEGNPICIENRSNCPRK